MTRTLLLSAVVALASITTASANPTSGMLLGIYAFPNY